MPRFPDILLWSQKPYVLVSNGIEVADIQVCPIVTSVVLLVSGLHLGVHPAHLDTGSLGSRALSWSLQGWHKGLISDKVIA